MDAFSAKVIVKNRHEAVADDFGIGNQMYPGHGYVVVSHASSALLEQADWKHGACKQIIVRASVHLGTRSTKCKHCARLNVRIGKEDVPLKSSSESCATSMWWVDSRPWVCGGTIPVPCLFFVGVTRYRFRASEQSAPVQQGPYDVEFSPDSVGVLPKTVRTTAYYDRRRLKDNFNVGRPLPPRMLLSVSVCACVPEELRKLGVCGGCHVVLLFLSPHSVQFRWPERTFEDALPWSVSALPANQNAVTMATTLLRNPPLVLSADPVATLSAVPMATSLFR